MKGLATRGLALASAVALAATMAACSKTPTETKPPYVAPQGVTDTEILFGTHQPLTGPASGGYSKIAPATKAYFQYVNDTVGGVYGRKINYKIVDDTYNPATTNTVVRQLIQEDKVFAILNGLGTPTHTGVLDVIKDAKIPDLFVASGATTWNQPSKYPGTFAVNPDYTNEGKILGSYIKTNMAGKKVTGVSAKEVKNLTVPLNYPTTDPTPYSKTYNDNNQIPGNYVDNKPNFSIGSNQSVNIPHSKTILRRPACGRIRVDVRAGGDFHPGKQWRIA